MMEVLLGMTLYSMAVDARGGPLEADVAALYCLEFARVRAVSRGLRPDAASE